MPSIDTFDAETRRENIRARRFCAAGSVHVLGDVRVSGAVIILGNLTVCGNLTADELYCAGSIVVHGAISAGTILFGLQLKAGGHLYCNSIRNGVPLREIASNFSPREAERYDANVRSSSIQDEFEAEIDELMGMDTISIGANFHSDDAIFIGNAFVAGHVWGENIDIRGSFTAGSIHIEDMISCNGTLECVSYVEIAASLRCGKLIAGADVEGDEIFALDDILVHGSITADAIEAGGNLQASDSIFASHNIKAEKYIKSGTNISSERGEIVAGEDYGIFAGMKWPRSQWFERGLVSAKKRPSRLLSGKYSSLTKFSHSLHRIGNHSRAPDNTKT